MAGLIESDRDGKFRKCYVTVGPDRFIAKYHKLHPFISPYITPGDSYLVIDLLEVKVGFLICYDNNLPENVRITTMLGAEVFIMPHVTGCTPSPMPGRGPVSRALWENRHCDPVRIRQEFQGPKGREWLMRWLPARCWENGFYGVFSNAIDIDDDTIKPGLAMILDPFGEVLAESRALDDNVVVALLTTERLEQSSGRRYLRARHPELNRKLVEPPPPGQEPVTRPGWGLDHESRGDVTWPTPEGSPPECCQWSRYRGSRLVARGRRSGGLLLQVLVVHAGEEVARLGSAGRGSGSGSGGLGKRGDDLVPQVDELGIERVVDQLLLRCGCHPEPEVERVHERQQLTQRRVRTLLRAGKNQVERRSLEHGDQPMEGLQVLVRLGPAAGPLGQNRVGLLLSLVDQLQKFLDLSGVGGLVLLDLLAHLLPQRLDRRTLGLEYRGHERFGRASLGNLVEAHGDRRRGMLEGNVADCLSADLHLAALKRLGINSGIVDLVRGPNSTRLPGRCRRARECCGADP